MEAINEAKAQIIEDHGLVVNSSEVQKFTDPLPRMSFR